MASHGPNHNLDYQAVPHTSDDADNVGHPYELGHNPASTGGGQDQYHQLQPADEDIYQPQMGSYDRKATVGTGFTSTTIKEYPSDFGRAQNAATPSWLPHALRWPTFSSILALTVILEILVAVFHGISSRDSGLVDDDGSGGIVVASKFVPTVLAVIHVLLISIILNDVKRTQAFAYLSSPHGTLGNRSLTWTAEAWWDALAQGFPGRGRKTNWALLCAALAFIFGFLLVSPFSSSLFVTEDIVFTYQVPFSKLDISSLLPLQASPLAATYFRTVGNILQNVTTSAWITEKYAIQPIWPARVGSVPLGPQFTDSMQTWSAKTTVFNVEESCEQMNLDPGGIFIMPFKNSPSIVNYTSVRLSSASGCILNVTDSANLGNNGGALWNSLSNLTTISMNNISLDSNGMSFTKANCTQDEYMVFTNSWGTNLTADAANLTIQGQACTTRYYMGDTNATVVFSSGNSNVQVNIDEEQYLSNRVEIPSTTANVSSYQDASLSATWSVHLAQPSQNFVAFSSGPATLLLALYNFDPTQIISDQSAVQNAEKIKQRFFGELLRDTFDNSVTNNPSEISGTTAETRRRVVVVPAVAIVLEISLGLQLVLLGVVFFMTRLSRRPLGLFADPAPAMSTAKLITKEPGTLQSFEGLHNCTLEEIRTAVANQRYQLTSDGIRLISPEVDDLIQSNSPEYINATETMAATNAKPQSFTFGIWLLIIFTLLLSATLIVIAYLYWYSGMYGLYQTAFVYAFDISIGGVDLSNVNPASIVTTFLAVLIGLWWGALETTMRRIQPFLSLAKEPVNGDQGLMVSYISSYLLHAVWKASRRGHFVLATVCGGAFLAEIFTIAMSSVWNREPGSVPFQVNVQRQLELRSVPHLSEATLQFTSHAGNYKQSALASLFSNLKTSWIYGAAVQISLNGSQPAWSSDGWSFVPHDLSTAVPQTDVQNTGNQSTVPQSSMNVTLQTSGIRARLECSPHEHLDITNTTSWLTEWDLTNATAWNQTLDPTILKTGYELGLNRLGSNTLLFLDNNASMSGNYTTFFVSNKRMSCCQNMTTDGQIGTSSVGYWSPNQRNNSLYPDFATSWPANFTVKWIHGRPVEGYHDLSSSSSSSSSTSPRLMWSEPPQMTALNCMPIIETVNASVTVSTEDSHVISFDLLDEPQPDQYAWSDDFKQHKNYDGLCESAGCDNLYSVNITTSHGILFVTGLLGAADMSNFAGDVESWNIATEPLDDQTFNIREPGLNADLMTYSMLSLVNYDHEALLDPATLASTATKTFTALFQNYASNNVSYTTGGYVFQPPNEALPSDLDQPVANTNTKRADTTSSSSSSSSSDSPITLHVERPVELLKMSKPAAWICMLILAYLIVATVILAVASRRYTRLLLRKIESIADVVVLMAGSEKLLREAREKGMAQLKADGVTKARLGWFTGADGAQRWGIEIVGSDDEKRAAGNAVSYDDGHGSEVRDGVSRGAESAAGDAREYNADGVSLLSSSNNTHNNHGGSSISDPSQTHYAESASQHRGGDLSPVSQDYGYQGYHQQWPEDYHHPAPPPHLGERRAPSIDINVDSTPFSSYFRHDDDGGGERADGMGYV
ncbi:uncharacterized protein F4807DRAFT_453588 [Annulohypoxylon truncatum]|uniref:uncharacterized protein n=1 Tax=Annulohypoxylon truncatum TaxID=327061 RepID=UPI002008C522|nr:uncharacterized protein F4807DRAFT_453588 [Annulohypoxylon truncatum]KAI1206168.1 hypothetical protein F4807DRAFT_453588 [Annulohypoxylon truncatum]